LAYSGLPEREFTMKDYKKRFAMTLAETGAIFFDKGLVLKDGRPTPYFVNMAVFRTGRLSFEVGSFFAGMMMSQGLVKDTDIILGPSYKGSAIAIATAIALWQEHRIDMAFDYDRKEPKTHGESSASKSILVNKALFDGCRIFIVDDVATSMGTKYDLLKKIETEARALNMKFRVVGIGIGIDREQTTAVYDKVGNIIAGTKGHDAIRDFEQKSGIPVYPLAGIREVITYLYKEKVPVLNQGRRVPIDERTEAEFDAYLEMYGVD
jgi:orotate phosphoribosyltransferase